ncbi:response regulator [Massilia sp. B-10]|nr:response regulator [Massilia sp. B-10]
MPAHASADGDDKDLIYQDDDGADLFAPSAQDGVPWRILIVDDDVDVHVVTKFALSNTHFQGRRLCFLHAYTAKEALTLLRETPDIAMVLLDVIMETPDAGLLLARQIREELHNDLVRIVLRTGQPGQALEHSIIVDYDINDFWCKADLTTRKLFTTVISSLRAYASMASAAAERMQLSADLSRAAAQLRGRTARAGAHARRAGASPKSTRRCAAWRGATRLPCSATICMPCTRCPSPNRWPDRSSRRWRATAAGLADIVTVSQAGDPVTLRCAALAFRDATGLPSRYVVVATPLRT